MTDTPKTIPDFGSDREGSAKRSRYIIEHADHFTLVHRYQQIMACGSLKAARQAAQVLSPRYSNPLMIYAVYGPYDTWVENYDGKHHQTKEGSPQKSQI